MYYVSVIDGPRIGGEIQIKRFGLLAGPYETHADALDTVDTVRRIRRKGERLGVLLCVRYREAS